MLLGVNIDHVATLRNARGGFEPDPIQAAHICEENGATSITAHLREDRRHIKDQDVRALKKVLKVNLNLEMAVTDEMQAIALEVLPHSVCLVPEKRQEVTTEGGLDVAGQLERVTKFVKRFVDAGIQVSLFIDPDLEQIKAAAKTGAQFIEMHTGQYSLAYGTESEKAEFEFKSEKVDAGVMVEFTIDDYGADEGYGFKWTDYNYYIEFRPIHEITLAWHDDIYTTASYLPVWDDNVSTGNFGSDGFTVVTRPYPGLRIAATIPFQFENDGPNTINFLNGDSDSGEDDFNFGFGFDYTLGNLFSVGFTMIDAVDSDERSYGVFASIMPKNNEDFIISAGFSGSESSVDVEELDFTDELSISATKLYQVACVYNYDALSLAAEIVGSIDKEENFYDLYTGVKAGYAIDDALSVSLTGKLFFDLGNEDGIDEAEPVIGFCPEVEYVYGAHTFSFGVAFQVCDGDTFVKFPVSWKYDL